MKLSKYNVFLLESVFYNLLLESKIEYGEDFILVLNELKKDKDISIKKIAVFLLEIGMSDSDLKLVQNYIGVDKDPSKVSFIPDNKVSAEILENSPLKINCDDDVLRNVVGDHSILDSCGISRTGLKHPSQPAQLPSNKWKLIGGPYSGARHGGAFSIYTLYLLQNIDDPTYKIVCFDNSSEDTKGFTKALELPEDLRGNVKIGRFINRIMDIWFKDNPNIGSIGKREDYTAADIEKFVNAYSAIILFRNNVMDFFEVVEGDDIKYWYLMDNYESQTSQLGNSCMKSKYCQDYFSIYTENPETCQLLIFKNRTRDKINGRAILWTDVNGKKWMDRIYTTKASYKELFTKWLTENNYEYLYNSDENVQVAVKNKDYEKYPYMDSLSKFKIFTEFDGEESLSPIAGLLSTASSDIKRPYYQLQETNGGYYKRS